MEKQKMKHFLHDEKMDYVTPKCYQSYHIGVPGLAEWNVDGGMLGHLVFKNWFTEEMFWELIAFCKVRFPKQNFDRHIFFVGARFKEIDMMDNIEEHYKHHKSVEKMTIKL